MNPHLVDALLGGFAALCAVGAIVAVGVVGWKKGRERGVDEGWRECEIEDATIDAEWEERDPELVALIRGKAPIRSLRH